MGPARSNFCNGTADGFIKISGVDDGLSIVARRDGGDGGKINCGRHHKAVCVIGVFSNQVDSAGGNEEGWKGPCPLLVQFLDSAYIFHEKECPLCRSRTCCNYSTPSTFKVSFQQRCWCGASSCAWPAQMACARESPGAVQGSGATQY